MWPPAGAVAVDVAAAYERLAARGYEYGPAFQGLQAMWRRGQRSSPRCPLRRLLVASVGSGSIPPCWTRPCMLR